jgi:hypothetical protein
MQQIIVHSSPAARIGLGGGFVLLSLLIGTLGLEPWAWITLQLAISVLMWRLWRQTAGFGMQLVLEFERGWVFQSRDGARQALTSIRPGLVTPALITAELHGERGRVPVVVLADAVSEEAHWQLRRLVLSGVAPAKRRA